MQYVAGRSLQEKIDRDGPLGLKEILRIGMQVAAGLAAAHAQGLVHRDIKPANILLENGVERAKITDFGLARAATDARLTQSGTVAGTPQYMAPEQARGEPVDHRTDLFSLGGVLYAMATGKPPFEGDSARGRAPAGQRRAAPAGHHAEPRGPALAGRGHRPADGQGPGRAVPVGRRGRRAAGRATWRSCSAPEASGAGAAGPAPVPSGRRAVRFLGKALLAGWRGSRRTRRGRCSARVERRRPANRRPHDARGSARTGRHQRPDGQAAARDTPRQIAKLCRQAPAGHAFPDWLVLGLAAKQRKDYAEAVRCLSEFLRQNPESTRALLARGDAYRYLRTTRPRSSITTR